MKLYVLDNGHLDNDYGCLIAMPHQAFIEDQEPKAEWMSVPVYTVLIESEGKLILFDTACHPDSMISRWTEFSRSRNPYFFTEAQLLPNALARLGHKPEDIDIVVMSHLHIDHGGCLEMFTNAEVYVNDDEFTQVMKLYALNGDMGAYVRKDIEGWLNAKLSWNLIPSDEDEVELCKGVTIINLGPGHVYGMLALLVELENHKNVLIASDAVNIRKNMGPPVRLPTSVYDSIGYRKSIYKISKLAKKYDAEVWCGHDMEQFMSLMKSDEGFYD